MLRECLEEAKQAAQLAGEEIVRNYKKTVRAGSAQELFPTTAVDTQANRIIQGILRTNASFAFLSEEFVDDRSRLDTEYVWIVDPLDGTKDFVEKTGDFCVMIALAKAQEIVLGVIYNPLQKSFTYALRGEGAFVEQSGEVQRVVVSSEDEFSKMKILMSRFHNGQEQVSLAKALGLTIIEKGSAGIKSIEVANGRAHIYVSPSPKTGEWDIAAGAIIVAEAGGIVTDTRGYSLVFNKPDPHNLYGFVMSNGTKHTPIVEALQKL